MASDLALVLWMMDGHGTALWIQRQRLCEKSPSLWYKIYQCFGNMSFCDLYISISSDWETKTLPCTSLSWMKRAIYLCPWVMYDTYGGGLAATTWDRNDTRWVKHERKKYCFGIFQQVRSPSFLGKFIAWIDNWFFTENQQTLQLVRWGQNYHTTSKCKEQYASILFTRQNSSDRCRILAYEIHV